jgi:hypothetical protein
MVWLRGGRGHQFGGGDWASPSGAACACAGTGNGGSERRRRSDARLLLMLQLLLLSLGFFLWCSFLGRIRIGLFIA